MFNEFGINSWNELLYFVFGEINYESKGYAGKQGLDRAIKKLKEFKKKYGKKPAANDKGIPGIYAAIGRGIWKQYGINSWNDLLRLVFGEVNNEKNKYVGKKELERAVIELRKMKKANKNYPKIREKGTWGMYRALKHGEWTAFGIINWNDLFQYSFNDLISDHEKRGD